MSLEPVRPEDVPLINRWWALPEVNLFWPGAGVPSLRQTEEWYERSARSEDSIVWVLRVNGTTIGQTFLGPIDWQNRHARSGVMIGDTSQWGRGYGSESVQLRTDYAFGELGLERLESESVAGNVGMHRALERSGYRKIGRRRHVFYRGGTWQDAFLFELLREEWETRRGVEL